MTRHSRLRVGFLTPFGLSGRGTVPHRVLPMALALRQMGVDVRIVVVDWEASPSRVYRHQFIQEGVELIVVPPPFSRAGLWGVRREASDFLLHSAASRLLLDWKPDVVHLVKPVRFTWDLLMNLRFPPFHRLFRAVSRVRVVLDCDDWELAWWRRQGKGRIKQALLGLAERLAWQGADVVTVASHFLYEQVSKVRSPSQVHYVPNIPWPWPPRTAPLHSRRILIPTRLLDIAPEVLGTWLRPLVHRLPRAHILIVGPQGEQLQSMAQVLQAYGLRDQVALLQWQPVEQYMNLLAHTRLGLYLVEDTEVAWAKCPARLVQMMAAGIPVVAVDVGEARHLLGDTGVLVPPSPDALAEAVSDLWHDASRLQTLGRAALHRAQSEYSLQRLGERLLRAYGESKE